MTAFNATFLVLNIVFAVLNYENGSYKFAMLSAAGAGFSFAALIAGG